MDKKSQFTSAFALATAIIVSLLPVLSNARTLWESDDTLSNINAIGFAHLDIASYDLDADQSAVPVNDGFQEARLALHVSSRFARRFTTFIEAEATATEDDINLEIERAIIKYDINNSSQISVGRYHSPVGYWNQFYHHGRWLPVTKDRPVQTEFGTGFLPSHYWGAMYEKKFNSDSFVVNLDLGVGEGRDESFSVFDGSLVTFSGTESVTAQINVSPISNRNLSFGTSFWYGDLEGNSNLTIGEQVFTAHVNLTTVSGEFLGEVSLVQHSYDNGMPDTDSDGGYLQYSHRLQSFGGRLKPYFRLDYLNVDEDDMLFSNLESTDRQTIGLRYDLTDNSALKFEIRRDDFSVLNESVNSLQAQIATFF